MAPRLLSFLILFSFAVAACGGNDSLEVGASTAESAQPAEELPPAEEPVSEDAVSEEAAPTPESEPAAADEPIPAEEATEAPPEEALELEPTPTISLDLASLPPLGDGGDYEVWLMDLEVPFSIGTFDIEDRSAIELPLPDLGFEPTEVQISIETDDDPGRSDSVVLAGIIDGDTVTLQSTYVGDFTDASGQYILATPTDGTGTPENERSGVWWTVIPRAQSLFLPQLTSGWVYEGWTVIDGQNVTMGTFTNPFGEPDSAAPFSGPEAGPPLVGEDYIINAPAGLTFPVDLRGAEVFISVEPFPDTGPETFTLIPLRGTIPADAIDHTAYSVENTAGTGPSGTATLNLA